MAAFAKTLHRSSLFPTERPPGIGSKVRSWWSYIIYLCTLSFYTGFQGKPLRQAELLTVRLFIALYFIQFSDDPRRNASNQRLFRHIFHNAGGSQHHTAFSD